MLELQQVSRRYGAALALAPLTLELEAGGCCVVMGANGSGKSTLLRLAAGLLTPSTGQRRATGRAVYLSSGSGARDAERVDRALAFPCVLRGDGADVDDVLHTVGLQALATKRVRTLSAGQRARLTLGMALAADADLVCLDEPTAHLDAAGVNTAARVVGRLVARGTGVLVATHQAAWLQTGVRLTLEGGRPVMPT